VISLDSQPSSPSSPVRQTPVHPLQSYASSTLPNNPPSNPHELNDFGEYNPYSQSQTYTPGQRTRLSSPDQPPTNELPSRSSPLAPLLLRGGPALPLVINLIALKVLFVRDLVSPLAILPLPPLPCSTPHIHPTTLDLDLSPSTGPPPTTLSHLLSPRHLGTVGTETKVGKRATSSERRWAASLVFNQQLFNPNPPNPPRPPYRVGRKPVPTHIPEASDEDDDGVGLSYLNPTNDDGP
jgi:hypothetical protein